MNVKSTPDLEQADLADVYTFRDGKAVAMRAFANRQGALLWAGVEQSSR
jgi:hypothetical protein